MSEYTMGDFILEDILTLIFWGLILALLVIALVILGLFIGYSVLGGQPGADIFNGQFAALLEAFIG